MAAEIIERSRRSRRSSGGQRAVPAPKTDRERQAATAGAQLGRALAGGRVSRDRVDQLDVTIGNRTPVLAPPDDTERNWRFLDLDANALSRVPAIKLMEYLADLSPDVSRALYDFLRLCNPGHTVTAKGFGADSQDPRGQALVDAFLGELEAIYGAVQVQLNRIFLAVFLRGAAVAELVLDQFGRVPVDLAVPDSATVFFERRDDPVRGSVWAPFQWQAHDRVYLDRETVRYIPIDPFPGSPYGRPLCSPALFGTLFLLGLLHDLRRVVAQQGYPRIDAVINFEGLMKSMPGTLKDDPAAVQQWVAAAIQEVQNAVRQLQPDDTYVHTDVVTMNKPIGAIDASSLGAIDGLITALERMATRALKTMPLLMGLTEGTSEANANRQWELMAAGIKSMQHVVENLLGRFLELACQAQGVLCNVEFRFAELRASEEMRDEQTLRLRLGNIALLQARGYIDQDTASQLATGHPPALPEPPYPTAGVQGAGAPPGSGGSTAGLGGPDAANPDPGSNRAIGGSDELLALMRTAGEEDANE